MGMFSPETERLRQLLAEQMTHTTSQSAGGGVTQAKQRMGLVPPWYQTLSGERAGQGFTEALQMMADQRGDMQIGDTSINPIDFVNPVAGIFGGKLAKTADLMALRDAMNRAAQGEDVRKVWQDTGWFQSPDGQWRFEIDDSASRLANIDRTTVGPLGDVFTHPQLQQAYPETARIDATFRTDGSGGSFHGPNSIVVRGAVGDEGRSVTNHELQHAIQQREGFARGGSPEYGISGPINYPLGLPMWDVLDSSDKLRRLADQFGESVPAMAARYRAAFKIDDDLMEQAIRLADDPSLPQLHAEGKKWAEMGPHEAYRRLAGEAEARAVQSRMNLTPEQRRMRFPLDDYDVPVDELIMRYGDGPAMSVPTLSSQGKVIKKISNRHYQAIDKETGEIAGELWLKEGMDQIADVRVPENYRGKGVANALYDEAEGITGKKIKPSDNLTEQGYKMWLRRNPEMVKDSFYAAKDKLLGRRITVDGVSGEIVDVGHNRLGYSPSRGVVLPVPDSIARKLVRESQ